MPKVGDEYMPPRLKEKVLEPTYRCPVCLDTGWTFVVDQDDDVPPAVLPCRSCRYIIARRRREGHYEPNHTCPECAAIRSGDVTPLDFDAEGNFIGGGGPMP